jgi:prophage regulatory protein
VHSQGREVGTRFRSDTKPWLERKRVKRKLERKAEPAERRIIRKPEVVRRTGYSAVQIWPLERDGLFPKRVQIGPMAVGWYENEISEWILSRVRRGGNRPPVQWRGGPTPRKVDGEEPPPAANLGAR